MSDKTLTAHQNKSNFKELEHTLIITEQRMGANIVIVIDIIIVVVLVGNRALCNMVKGWGYRVKKYQYWCYTVCCYIILNRVEISVDLC